MNNKSEYVANWGDEKLLSEFRQYYYDSVIQKRVDQSGFLLSR